MQYFPSVFIYKAFLTSIQAERGKLIKARMCEETVAEAAAASLCGPHQQNSTNNYSVGVSTDLEMRVRFICGNNKMQNRQ